MPPVIFRFKACYENFNSRSLPRLDAIYSPNATLIDPIHKIAGLPKISAYFNDMCTNLISCRFVYQHEAIQDNTVFIQWHMLFKHKSLAGGREIVVPGVTRLTIENDLIVEHEDFYDMGAMVYEQIPLLGRLITWLRCRLATTTPHIHAKLSSTSL